MKPVKYCDLLLYSEEDIHSENELLYKHQANLGYLSFLSENIVATVIQIASFNKQFTKSGVNYKIVNAKNGKWLILWRLFWQIRKEKYDVILIHGFIYAWQIIFLRICVGKKSKLILQNHAEGPFLSLRRIFQKIVDRFISVYLFVSKEQTKPWIDAGVIKNNFKVEEMMEGSTSFEVLNRSEIKTELNLEDVTIFLWVGRLDENKDPLTVVKAFNSYTKINKSAQLWMIYGTDDLKEKIESYISLNTLKEQIKLLGIIEHSDMIRYYNAADYFILGSHSEGSGYALCEAMACGCVPIVTNISSFRIMLNEGECGYLFEPGNLQQLISILLRLNNDELKDFKQKVLKKFHNDLSFQAIGRKLSAVINNLVKV